MPSQASRKTGSGESVARRLTVPVAIILGASVLTVCGLIWYAARVLDDVAIDNSTRVLQAKLAELERRSSVDAKDRTWWDDAQIKLFGEHDTIWAENNFGEYAYDTLGWSTVFILDAAGAPLFSWVDGDSFGRTRTAFEYFNGGLDRLIESAQESPMGEPEAATGLLIGRNGIPHIVAASPFTWETPILEQRAAERRPILVISSALDGPRLTGIARDLNVRDLRIQRLDDPGSSPSMALITPDGSSAGYLTWSLDLPGERLATTLLPGIVVIFGGMGWLLWLVFGRANRAARQIETGARLLAAQNSAVERSEQRIRAVMDNVADGIFTIDADGGLESANPAALRQFGYDASAMMSKNLVSLIDCPKGFQILAAFRGHSEVPARIQGATGRRADGTSFPIDLSTGEVAVGDRRLLIVVVRDMTEREKQAEDLRRARDSAEQADRAKSDFLAHISHELRTPLNAIIGFSEMYRSKIFGPLGDERYDEYAVHIHDSGTHLLALINDILDLSRADIGRIELHESDLAVDAAIDASIEMVRGAADEAGLDLQVDTPADMPRLRADERRLRQVMINLLGNAVKFTPRGGRIALRSELDGEDRIRIVVRDTGIGMHQDDVEKAFVPFKQVDTTLTRRYLGAGIGLSLTRRLVEAHDAEISIMSRPNEGTTVTVVFPPERTVHPDNRMAG